MATIFKRYPQACALVTTGMLVMAFVILLVREFLLHTLFQRPLENIANALFLLGIVLAYSCVLTTRSFLQNSQWYISVVYWFLVLSPWITNLCAFWGPFFVLQRFLVVALLIGAFSFPFLVFKESRKACILALPFASLPVILMGILGIVILNDFIEYWPEEPNYVIWAAVFLWSFLGVFNFVILRRRMAQSSYIKYFYTTVFAAILVIGFFDGKRMIKPLIQPADCTKYTSYDVARACSIKEEKPLVLIYGCDAYHTLEKIAENYLICELCKKYQNDYVILRAFERDELPECIQKEIEYHLGYQQIALIDPISETYVSVIAKWNMRSLKQLIISDSFFKGIRSEVKIN